ncbi:Diphthamide biosynthesis protein 3 [Coemansia sp. RSA 1694]|nr:Diphthamide biosynthesis protein 3 [Coemansia sp. RSA 1694]
MTSFYDEIEIEDMEFDEDEQTYYYPCPCGDRFQITRADLTDGEDVAMCPSCSLLIRVIYDPDDFPPDEDDEEEIMLHETGIAPKSGLPALAQPISAAPASNEDKVALLVSKLAVSATTALAQRSGADNSDSSDVSSSDVSSSDVDNSDIGSSDVDNSDIGSSDVGSSNGSGTDKEEEDTPAPLSAKVAAG